ncbi:MAG: L,D-transpeptidase family protein [Patescibacteria group bacterium]|nr:L,D-transpeptidase family protein [Patescibacteria group bacterium]
MLFHSVWLVLFIAANVNILGLPCRTYKVKSGDTLSAICQSNAKAEFVAQLNGVDPWALQIGRILYLPTNWSACQNFTPLPKYLPERKSEKKFTLIVLSQELLGMYESGRLIRWCRITPGKVDHPTPTGLFRIQWKDLDHESNLHFDRHGRPLQMPYGVNIGDEYWIHKGTMPGYADSHGCVRLRNLDASFYYDWALTGSSVYICSFFPSNRP